MGRSAKNLKKRGHKVTRRVDARRMKRVFGSEEIKSQWVVGKTMAQNCAALGLETNVNRGRDIARLTALRLRSDGEAPSMQAVDPDDVKALAAAAIPEERTKPADWMYDDELEYLGRLIAKHGEGNAAAMARDIKTNSMQHSAAHLATRLARRLRFLASRAAGGGGGVAEVVGRASGGMGSSSSSSGASAAATAASGLASSSSSFSSSSSSSVPHGVTMVSLSDLVAIAGSGSASARNGPKRAKKAGAAAAASATLDAEAGADDTSDRAAAAGAPSLSNAAAGVAVAGSKRRAARK